MTNWDKPDADILADMRKVQEANERSLHEYAPFAVEVEHLPTPPVITAGKAAMIRLAPGTVPNQANLAAALKAASEAQLKAFQEAAQSAADVMRKLGAMHRMPPNRADRRTIRLAGKPKHYILVGNTLHLMDGESPWT